MSPTFGSFADTGEFELAEEELPFVRLVAQLGGALLEMSSKYGCRPEEAAKLMKRVQAAGAAPSAR